MQTVQKHYLIRDGKTARIVSAATGRKPEPRHSVAADASMALEMDRRWRAEVQKQLVLIVSDARNIRRAVWKPKPLDKDSKQRAYFVGQVRGLMAAARRLKGLL